MEKMFPHDYFQNLPTQLRVRTDRNNCADINCGYVYTGCAAITKIPRKIEFLDNGIWKPYPVVAMFTITNNPSKSFTAGFFITSGGELEIKRSPEGMRPDLELLSAAAKMGILATNLLF
jgi:hypothetical protein